MCSIDACIKPRFSRGLCQAHYTQARRGTIPMPDKLRKVATVCHCGQKEYAKGVCHKHYMADYSSKNSSRIKKQRKEYRSLNKETIQAKKAAYHVANREIIVEKTRQWRLNNPDKRQIQSEKDNRSRRARIRGVASERYSAQDVLDKYGTDCHLCLLPINLEASRKIGTPGWEISLHIDHYVSLALGGDNTLANARPAHGLCNLRKGRGTRT